MSTTRKRKTEAGEWLRRAAAQPAVRTAGSILLPLLAILPGLGLILYYILGPAAGHMTSDCTDSLRWAQASLISGKLISDNFDYAALLPFGGNQIFLPFLLIFGYGMRAQVAGLALFAVLFAAALYYVGRGLDFSRTASAGLASIVMLVLSSGSKLREILWEHIFYYNLGLLFFCVGLGLCVRILKSLKKEQPKRRDKVLLALRLVLLGVFSLFAATDGLQTLVCYTLPILAGLFAERFLDPETPFFSRKNGGALLTIALVFICSAVGFFLIPVISHGVSAGYADAYSSYSGMANWTENFHKLFNHWFTLLGVSVTDGQHFVTVDSVFQALKIFGALFLLFFPLGLLLRLPSMENQGLKVLTVGHAAVTAFILFAFVFGRLGAANWRLTPVLGTGLLTTCAAVLEGIRRKGVLRRFGAVGIVFLALLALQPALEIRSMPADHGNNAAFYTVAAELESRGLKYGYAHFWWCQLLTMVSENRVQVSTTEIRDRIPTRHTYQDYRDNYLDKPTDRYFLLLNETENRTVSSWIEEQRLLGRITESIAIPTEEYLVGGYRGSTVYVYVFNVNFLNLSE
ncbi:MAG: hypothetical protein ILP12_03400 [Lachnospiraceae bacterium]|nr:hypothetical protein [Lachnospiraceae bacterium]